MFQEHLSAPFSAPLVSYNYKILVQILLNLFNSVPEFPLAGSIDKSCIQIQLDVFFVYTGLHVWTSGAQHL